MEKNLTNGGVLKNIVSFSLPYLLSYFLQTLYGMADLFIIGQFSGTADITAVSIGSQVMHMLTVMIVGLAMGATITIGRAVGGREHERAALAVGNSVTLFMAVSLVLTAVLLALVRPIAAVMSTPAEAVEGTVQYLTICFVGIPFITAYNIISSIFRGLGDSKSPMYFVAVACAANIGLDYLFMGGMGMGPAGAALGTTLSQTLSVVVALAVITRQKTGLPLGRASFKPRRDILGPILKVGVPVALQDGFIQVSFILITIIANNRGLNDAAAVGIVEKVISFVFLVPSSMLSTVSALAAQNAGAGKDQRAAQTLRYAVTLCVGFGLAVGIVLMLLPLKTDLLVLAGLVVFGLGCAPVYPSIIPATPANFGADKSQAIIGMQMASAYVGSTFMPPLFGWLSGLVGLQWMPVYLAFFTGLMIVMLEITWKKVAKANHAG